MVFQEGADVPFWMTTQECVATDISQYDQPQLKLNTKAELFDNLKSSGVDISVVDGKRLGEPQDLSRKNQVSVTKIIRN